MTSTPFRKMKRPSFKAQQHAGIRLPHIAPFNELVDELRAVPGRGWMPYLAPLYGGTSARVLSVFQDPGPKTDATDGSGMLCVENDDPAAQYMSELLAAAGISPAQLNPWNAYPWYVHERRGSTKLRASDLEAGVGPLLRMINLMPRLEIIMLHGGAAHRVWDRLAVRQPSVARRYEAVKTFHTARTAFRAKDPAVREARRQHLEDSFAHVARRLGGASPVT